jgi:type VI secretion system secreted protein Hcp
MFDCFIKVDGAPGESQDSKHKDWIEVLSFNWGVEQEYSGSRSSGGAITAERVQHKPFSFVHAVDKSSPVLFHLCCIGKHIPNIVMELCRATGDKQKYMEFKLSNSIVTKCEPGGASKDNEPLPMEEVAFTYDKMQVTYTSTDQKTGAAKGDITKWWSCVENKGG